MYCSTHNETSQFYGYHRHGQRKRVLKVATASATFTKLRVYSRSPFARLRRPRPLLSWPPAIYWAGKCWVYRARTSGRWGTGWGRSRWTLLCTTRKPPSWCWSRPQPAEAQRRHQCCVGRVRWKPTRPEQTNVSDGQFLRKSLQAYQHLWKGTCQKVMQNDNRFLKFQRRGRDVRAFIKTNANP